MKSINIGIQNKLSPGFYLQHDVVLVARQLLGKVLVTNFNNELTAARIVETEAYNGITDKASHAYNDRRTNRTKVMYAEGGHAYVYLCYGLHYLFNVVCNTSDVPHAVLVRAAEPLTGIETMLRRTGKTKAGYDLTRGPANLSKALGITVQHTGLSLMDDALFIADDNIRYTSHQIGSTVRIGVDYAAEDALLPYRFIVKGSRYLSGNKRLNEMAE